MTGLAITLVLISAVAHSSWNLLVRRATTPELFTWWMAMAVTVLGAPVVAYVLITDPPDAAGWAFVGGTIVLHTGYFTFLGRAYRTGDLSTVYPVSRGLGIALIPAVAFLAIDESVSWQAGLGIGLIILGIFAVASGRQRAGAGGQAMGGSWQGLLRTPGLVYALLTGLTIAGYSVVDKQGVKHVYPLLYVILLTTGGGTGMLLTLSRRYQRAAFNAELRRHWRAIVIAGVLQTAAYGLVLFALRVSPVSYVGPFREVGVVFGVIMGALVLKERVTRLRLAGAAVIACGAVAIALAP